MKYKLQSITDHEITLENKETSSLSFYQYTALRKNSITTGEITLRDTDWKFLAVNTMMVLRVYRNLSGQ